MFLFPGLIVADSITDLEQSLKVVDEAITNADDAWISAFVQVKIFDAIINSFDQSSSEAKQALEFREAYQAQVDQQSPVLNSLYEKRLQLGSVLNFYKEALSGQSAQITEKLTLYQKQYVDLIAACSDILKLIESFAGEAQTIIVRLQKTSESEDVTAFEGIYAKINNNFTEFKSKFEAIRALGKQLQSELPTFQLINLKMTTDFVAWVNQQQTVISGFQKSFDSRLVYLNELSAQFEQIKKQIEATLAEKKTADTDDAQVKKAQKVALAEEFKKVSERASVLSRNMSDQVWGIVSDIGRLDKVVVSLSDVGAVVGAVAQADEITKKMSDIGSMLQEYSSNIESLKKILESMPTAFVADEIKVFQSNFLQLTDWSSKFEGTLKILKDQFSMARMRLEKKQTDLAGQTGSNSGAVSAQLLEGLSQMKVEAGSVIQDVLTPLVMGISQKIMGLADFFANETQTEQSLNELKNALVDVENDSNAIDEGIAEYSVWTQKFNEEVVKIEGRLSDQTMKDAIAGLKKSFESFSIWSNAVVKRQDAIKKTLAASRSRYEGLVNKNKVATEVLYKIEMLLKDIEGGRDFVDTKHTEAVASYEKLKLLVEGAADLDAVNKLLEDFKALLTLIVEVEGELKQQQESIISASDLAKQSGVVGDFQKNLGNLQVQINEQVVKSKKLRVDFTSLNQQALTKKQQFSTSGSSNKTSEEKEDFQNPASRTQQTAGLLNLPASAIQEAVVSQPAVLLGDPVISKSVVSGQAVGGSLDEKIISLAAFVKSSVDKFAAVKKFIQESKAILDQVKSDDDYKNATARIAELRKQLTAYQGVFEKISQDVQNLRKVIDDDKAAGRIVSPESSNGVVAIQLAVDQATKDFETEKNGANQLIAGFQKVSDDFSKKASELSIVTQQASAVAQKIQQLSAFLDRIKAAIKQAQDSLKATSSAVVLEQAITELTSAERLKDTINNQKINEVAPLFQTLKKQVIPRFVQAYGALPSDLAQRIDKQGLWIDAVDSSVENFMKTIAELKGQVSTRRDAVSQDSLKTLESLSFAQQLKFLEDKVPEIYQSAQVEIFMKELKYVFDNRYGNKPEDKNTDAIENNKARLSRLLDFVGQNRRFVQRRSILNEFKSRL